MRALARITPQHSGAAQTVLNEQSGMQARGVTDRFGQRPMHLDARPGQFVANSPNKHPTAGMNMQPGFGSYESNNVSSRADKWSGQPYLPP